MTEPTKIHGESPTYHGTCPYCASAVSCVTRDGMTYARCSHRGCGARGPYCRDLVRAVEWFTGRPHPTKAPAQDAPAQDGAERCAACVRAGRAGPCIECPGSGVPYGLPATHTGGAERCEANITQAYIARGDSIAALEMKVDRLTRALAETEADRDSAWRDLEAIVAICGDCAEKPSESVARLAAKLPTPEQCEVCSMCDGNGWNDCPLCGDKESGEINAQS